MFAKHGKLNFATRLTAGTTLLAWLSALVFCAAECFSGGFHCAPAEHHEAAVAHHGGEAFHHDQDATSRDDSPADPGHCNNSLCDSLKSIAHTSGQAVLVKPSLPLAYFLPSFVSSTSACRAQTSSQFCEPRERDWVFRPEVCLGPAFRSLAPPAFSRF